jgi:hypothetical protein
MLNYENSSKYIVEFSLLQLFKLKMKILKYQHNTSDGVHNGSEFS